MTITQTQIKELFEYRNGELYWKRRTSPTANAGDIAGNLKGNGYKQVTINNKLYLLHRIIYLWHHGYIPKLIDHRDNNGLNNRIENLRDATSNQNQNNRKLSKASGSGVKDVYKVGNKWQVRFTVSGKRKAFGCYYDIEVAKFVADTMRHKYHGQFARNS